VQTAQERAHPAPLVLALELAELARSAVDVRVDPHRVSRVEAPRDRSVAGSKGREDELQLRDVAQRGGHPEGAIE
jgi:hypothetical protein